MSKLSERSKLALALSVGTMIASNVVGGIIVSAKSLYYEWVRTVAKSIEYETSGIETPAGLIL